jgi:NadR type nicotinamide-nucleotide adenylyltransferase
MEGIIPKQTQRSGLIRVVLFGPESTGKTTLSRDLASHYKAPWVPEFARDFLQEKWDRTQQICTKEDLIPIATGQISTENNALLEAGSLLICDTDVLETLAYSYWYFGPDADHRLVEAAQEAQYDLYFLTYIDTPWMPDDLRDQPEARPELFAHFENCLKRFGRNFVILKGNPHQRLNKAIEHIDNLIHHL